MEHILALKSLLADLFSSYEAGLGVLSTGLAALLVGYWWWKSARLIVNTFAGMPSARSVELFRILARATLVRVVSQQQTLGSAGLFDLVRLRVEHELVVPRPVPGSDAQGASLAELLAAWRKCMRKSFVTTTIRGLTEGNKVGGMPHLTPGDINSNAKLIVGYFMALKKLGVRDEDLHFLARVVIDGGFLSPLHLLAGSLSRFEADWRKILAAYEREIGEPTRWLEDVCGYSDQRTRVWIRSFREIQRSLFDCWLQWGPSIPNSTRKGDRGVTTLQYGYGDESNSIEVVGPRPFLAKSLEQLWQTQQRPALAVPCRATGFIAHTKASVRLRDQVSPALQASWRSSSENLEDGRIALWVDGNGEDALLPGEPVSYYSAYLWALFVVLVRDRHGRVRPLHPREYNAAATTRPWLDLLPVFEHCNVASASALAMGKEVLAAKALNTIRHIAQLSGKGGSCALRFAYACAIDDPGARKRPWIEELGLLTGAPTIAQALQNQANATGCAWLVEGDDPILRLEYYDSEWDEYDRPYTTHELIEHVQHVLNQIEQSSTRART